MWVQIGNFYFLLPPLVLKPRPPKGSMTFAYTCYIHMHVGMPKQALEWLPLGLEFYFENFFFLN